MHESPTLSIFIIIVIIINVCMPLRIVGREAVYPQLVLSDFLRQKKISVWIYGLLYTIYFLFFTAVGCVSLTFCL